MSWRVAVIAAAAITASEAAPAFAQFYGQENYGRRPFWEQRQRERQQQWGYGDWGYGNNAQRQPITRSGGARPAIAPAAPPKVAFASSYAPGSIVIDSEGRMLYYVLSPSEAYQYPISVGREGFSWTGTETVSRKQAWPDWHPPKEMLARDRRLPNKMTGGLKNPLGAMALYLGNTLYRIHGTNDPKSIGRAASSGCFRMMNEHVLHLASLADVGTSVTVVKRLPGSAVAARTAPQPRTVAQPEHDGDPYARAETEDDPYDSEPQYAPRYDRYAPYSPYGRYGRYERYNRWGDPL
jgi:lipoprotein-anchoring transpeptidase ErfK/SrfK